MLHGMIHVQKKRQTSKPKKKDVSVALPEEREVQENVKLFDLMSAAKNDGMDIVQVLKEHISVVEVCL